MEFKNPNLLIVNSSLFFISQVRDASLLQGCILMRYFYQVRKTLGFPDIG